MAITDLDHIRQNYAGRASQEWDRLRSAPIRRIEYLITSYCLEKYLPETGYILDAGSGPGRYAIDLARKGYRVVMLDLLGEMLQLGQQKVAEAGVSDSIAFAEGNMTDLPFPENLFDAVISLGTPLSHLTDARSRSRAIAELARVVKPAGLVLLTGLSRLASYRGAVFWLEKPEFFVDQIVKTDFRTSGIILGTQVWYTFAPGEMEGLAQGAGLKVIERIGCEGLANHLPIENLEKIEANPECWPVWKEILLETCNEPSIIGISNHLMVIARKL